MFKRVVKKILSDIFYLASGRNFIALSGRPKVNGFCKFGAKLVLGANVNFNGARTYGAGKVYIGDNFHSGVGLRVLTQSHNYNGESIPYDRTVVVKDVVIGDNVTIGNNCIIYAGVKIYNDCIIGNNVIIHSGTVIGSDGFGFLARHRCLLSDRGLYSSAMWAFVRNACGWTR